ncbi:hypothetical protein GCM10027048_13040 [Hymenobacter coalescens]
MRTIGGMVAIGLGVALSAVGTLFHMMRWPDVFQGRYIGPLLIVAGTLWVAVAKIRAASPADSSRIRLHSVTTYWPKYFVPVLFTGALVAVAAWTRAGGMPMEAGVPAMAFLVFLLALSGLISYFIHFGYCTDDHVYFRRYGAEKAYRFADVVSITQLLVGIYLIQTNDKVRRLLLPDVDLLHPFEEPASIQKMRNDTRNPL